MSKHSSLPEILFERLSDYRPDTHVALLASANYRQYLFVLAGDAAATFDGINQELLAGTVVSIPAQIKCELYFAENADGIWFAVLEEFLSVRVIPCFPDLAKPHSEFWQQYYTVLLRTKMTGAAQLNTREKIMHELLLASERFGIGCDAVILGYLLVVLFSAANVAVSATTSDQQKQHDECDMSPHAADCNLVLTFRQLVEKKLNSHWNINQYCRQLGVTPRRLLFACKHVTGKFPKTLLHERLMHEARANLNYSEKSISEIAYALGFKSAAYFSHFYKRHAGTSPRQDLQSHTTVHQ
ncbi:MAG: hypothetical protein JWM78_434 [Verrucomicrobiaceae bacterium]|nr:hypothetical protein [Verrucomicrobiaceae bacterium]